MVLQINLIQYKLLILKYHDTIWKKLIWKIRTVKEWKIKNIDIPPNETVTYTKEDAVTYLLTCDTCEVTIEDDTHTFNQYDIKKLTKDNEYSIKNVSDKICKVIVICR